jgi:hypothetical protein
VEAPSILEGIEGLSDFQEACARNASIHFGNVGGEPRGPRPLNQLPWIPSGEACEGAAREGEAQRAKELPW